MPVVARRHTPLGIVIVSVRFGFHPTAASLLWHGACSVDLVASA
ncbi:hypothetical protein X977_5609 [Burkholderia pseudomallei MSHR7504]|nr:hypothetical protein X977_5609 [Burkholderia pseudomallei MSHR7504]